MSLPTNRKAFDPSLFDSLTQTYRERPNELLQSPLGGLRTESSTMSIRRRSNESFSNYTDDPSPAELYERERRHAEKLWQMQMMYSPDPAEMLRFDSALLSPVMATKVSEAISASLEESIRSAPSPSSTVPSSLSGDSVTTWFLSRTSAKNSTSNPSSSKSGPPKLLSSPLKAIATKSSIRS
jgi:hypothetical protein